LSATTIADWLLPALITQTKTIQVMQKKRLLHVITLSMKLTITQVLLSAFFTFGAFAKEAKAQGVLDKLVTINAQNTEIKKVIAEIKRKTDIEFIYSSNVIQSERKISVTANEKKLSDVLAEILVPLRIGYKLINDQVLLFNLDNKATIKDDNGFTTITGIITNSKTGEPLAGATVSIKGKNKAVTTDSEGKFTINAEAGDVLIISSVGYLSYQLTVSTETNYIVKLAASDASLGSITVIGSRSNKPRTDVDRPVPVDILSAKELQATGQVELGQQVQFMSPSFNSAKNGINGIANYADPASLKGLSPDQMLVLIEGKRYHQFAAVQNNVTVGKGTVVTDLNAVPSLALERMEILRDGAAAQYGSDAIAGIVNLVLKRSVNKGTAQIQYGATSKGDGGGITLGLNYGFSLGKKGFLNVTGSYQDVKGTQRSDVYNPQPVTGGTYTGIYSNTKATDEAALLSRHYWGDGTYGSFKVGTYGSNAMKSGQLFYNSGAALGKGWDFYSFGNYSNKQVFAQAFLRTAVPTSATSNVDLYPDGYVPKLPGTSVDYSAVVGFKRKVADGWDLDFSTGYGSNRLDQNANGSSNASLGPNSPMNFYAGRVGFGQSLTEANISKKVDHFAGTKSFNIAFGAQYRVDKFYLKAGDEASYIVGPLSASKNKTPGSQGRVGIDIADVTKKTRSNIGLYADAESDITKSLLIAAAMRYENYSDFGGNVSGKLAARLKLTEHFAIRGSINKGFRAPLLQQIANAATTSTVQAGVISSTKQLPSSEPRLAQVGITDPKPENSWNYNLGITAKGGNNFLFTADAYQINISDRIIITENLKVANIVALKNLFPGYNEITFFTNAINTKTKGIDLVASYKKQITAKSRFTSSLALTFNKTEISSVKATPDALQAGTVAKVILIDTITRALIETSQPHKKILLSLAYQIGKLNFNLRSTYFGEVTGWEKPTGGFHRSQTFAGKNLFDASIVYNINKHFSAIIGGNNITNVYPDKIYSYYASYTNGQVPYTRNANQFGFNGAYYYGTVTINF
jgi:iron complex outermembrane recepter protein